MACFFECWLIFYCALNLRESWGISFGDVLLQRDWRFCSYWESGVLLPNYDVTLPLPRPGTPRGSWLHVRVSDCPWGAEVRLWNSTAGVCLGFLLTAHCPGFRLLGLLFLFQKIAFIKVYMHTFDSTQWNLVIVKTYTHEAVTVVKLMNKSIHPRSLLVPLPPSPPNPSLGNCSSITIYIIKTAS